LLENKFVSKYKMQKACPWARVEFFLDRTLVRLKEKKLITHKIGCGYQLAVHRKRLAKILSQGAVNIKKEK